MVPLPFLTDVTSADGLGTVVFCSVKVHVLTDTAGQFIILSDENVCCSNGLLSLPDSLKRVPITWAPVAPETRTISFQATLSIDRDSLSRESESH